MALCQPRFAPFEIVGGVILAGMCAFGCVETSTLAAHKLRLLRTYFEAQKSTDAQLLPVLQPQTNQPSGSVAVLSGLLFHLPGKEIRLTEDVGSVTAYLDKRPVQFVVYPNVDDVLLRQFRASSAGSGIQNSKLYGELPSLFTTTPLSVVNASSRAEAEDAAQRLQARRAVLNCFSCTRMTSLRPFQFSGCSGYHLFEDDACGNSCWLVFSVGKELIFGIHASNDDNDMVEGILASARFVAEHDARARLMEFRSKVVTADRIRPQDTELSAEAMSLILNSYILPDVLPQHEHDALLQKLLPTTLTPYAVPKL